jgi:hypothetical protein
MAEFLEPYNAVRHCEQCIVAAAADIVPRVNLRAALTVQNRSARHVLTVRPFRTEPV